MAKLRREIRRYPTVALLAMVSAMMLAVTTAPAAARGCGGLNQRACTVFTGHPGCGHWLREERGFCRRCGGRGQQACFILGRSPACRRGLAPQRGRCEPRRQTAIGGLKRLVVPPRTARRVRYSARRHVGPIQRVAEEIINLRLGGGPTRAIADALRQRRVREAQRIFERNPQVSRIYAGLRRMGYHTLTLGLESSAEFVAGFASETGASIDLYKRRPAHLYTTTAAAAGYYFGAGYHLVISALRSNNVRIGGLLFGTVAEFEDADGLGADIWFTSKPFEYEGFSVGLGVGAIGEGGAVTAALTKVY